MNPKYVYLVQRDKYLGIKTDGRANIIRELHSFETLTEAMSYRERVINSPSTKRVQTMVVLDEWSKQIARMEEERFP